MASVPRNSAARTSFWRLSVFPEWLWRSVSLSHSHPTRERWLQRDPRFARGVTADAPEICLGELLAQLGRQTGIPLLIGDEDGAAGETVAVLATELPLVDLCLALHSLVSFRGGAWRWEETTTPDGLGWRLSRPKEARDHLGRFRRRMDDALIETVEESIRLAHATREEREEAARRSERWKPILDETMRLRVLGLEGFLPSREARADFVRGRRSAEFPAAAWNDAARQVARLETERFLQGNPQQGAADPDTIQLVCERTGASVTPRIGWRAGRRGFMLGGAVAGGVYLEAYGRERFVADWYLDDDRPRDSERESAPVRTREVSVSDDGIPPGKSLAAWRRLRAFHAGSRVPLLLWCGELPEIAPPRGLDSLPPELNALPPAELAAILAEREQAQSLRAALDANGRFLAKWRGPVLLMLHPQVVWVDDAQQLPWALRQWMRANLVGDATGMVGFETVCELALRVSPAQAKVLEAWKILTGKGRLWPVLPRELARRAMAAPLVRGEAIAWKALPVAVQDALRAAVPRIGVERPEKIRLLMEDSDAGGTLLRTFAIRVENADGVPLGAPMIVVWQTPPIFP